MAHAFALGAKARINGSGEIGVIRYHGPLHFIEGDWIGLELELGIGKNNGEVNGRRYFTCEPKHGIFVKTTKVTPIQVKGPKKRDSVVVKPEPKPRSREVTIQELKTDLETKEAMIQELKTEIKTKECIMDEFATFEAASQATIQELKTELESKEATILELTTEIESKEAFLDNLEEHEAASDELSKIVKETKELADEKEKRILAQDGIIQKHLATIEELTTTLSKTTQTNRSLEEQIKIYQGQEDEEVDQDRLIVDLCEKNHSLETSLRDVNARLDDALEMKALLQEEVNMYLEDLEEFRKIEGNRAQTIEQLKEALAKVEKSSSDMHADLVAIRKEKEVLEQENARREEQIQEHFERSRKSQKLVSSLQRETFHRALHVARTKPVEQHNSILATYTRQGYNKAVKSVEALQRLLSINLKIDAVQGCIKSNLDLHRESDKLYQPKCISLLGQIKLTTGSMETYLKTVPASRFLEFGHALNGLTAIEQSVDSWIDGLDRDSLGQRELMNDLDQSIDLIKNSVETYCKGSESGWRWEHSGDRQLEYIHNTLEGVQRQGVYLKEMIEDSLHLIPDSAKEEESLLEQYQQDTVKNLKSIETADLHLKTARQVAEKRYQKDRAKFGYQLQQEIDTADEIIHETLDSLFTMSRRLTKKVEQDHEDVEENIHGFKFSDAINKADHDSVAEKIRLLENSTLNIWKSLDNPKCMDEILEEDSQAPWIEHNIVLDAEEADLRVAAQKLTARDTELLEKNTTIAIKNRAIDELNVSVEVLGKRLADSKTASSNLLKERDQLLLKIQDIKTEDVKVQEKEEPVEKNEQEDERPKPRINNVDNNVVSEGYRRRRYEKDQYGDISVAEWQNRFLLKTLKNETTKIMRVLDFQSLYQPK